MIHNHYPHATENDSRVQPFIIKTPSGVSGVSPLFRSVENGHRCPRCEATVVYHEGRNGHTWGECDGTITNKWGYEAGVCGALFANSHVAFADEAWFKGRGW